MTATVAEIRHPAAAVRPLAEALRARLADHAERVEIGGSLRRGKPDVKDVELVALNPTPGFYAYLDELIEAGKVTKARYGVKQTTRWGEKLRCLAHNGIHFEIDIADSNNWGWKYALRTGPGKANTYLMTELGRKQAPYRFQEGYAWVGDWRWLPNKKGDGGDWVDPDRRLLAVPDEAAFFRLLGLPFIEPPERSAERYRQHLSAPGHRFDTVPAATARQLRLDLGAYDYVEPEVDKKNAGSVSVPPSTAQWHRECREWDALPPTEKRRRMIVEELEFGSIENWRRAVDAYKQRHGIEEQE